MEAAFWENFGPQGGWLAERTVLLVRHGSKAYGTHTPTSDEDYKGIAIAPRACMLGFHQRFEQAELRDPDTVIYDLRKFFSLAAACNPNIIEVLHVDPEDQLLVDPLGRSILEHRERFLSRRVKHTFTGYAVSQLKRIQTHRRWLLDPPQTPPTRADFGLPDHTVIPGDQLAAAQAEIQRELDRMSPSFLEDLGEPQRLAVRTAMTELLAELRITSDQQWAAAGRRIGLDDNFLELMKKEREYASRHTEWKQFREWQARRNRERYELEARYGYDTKHAYHLVRLIRMCREILETGQVLVRRPDREELMAIRQGAWSYDQLLEFAQNEERELEALYQRSPLPRAPDYQFLDELCVELVASRLA